MSKHIELIGVQTHNLKNINVKIPRNKLTVITGVSGSGKSSLAFTTLCSEGQRRYLESLSTYARMFVGGTKEEAKVQEIRGLSPTISIDQKTTSHNPRSTVGTITEIYDFYRLLFLHIGVQHCPEDGTPLTKNTKEDIVAHIQGLGNDAKIFILAPIREEFETFEDLKRHIVDKGFVRFMVGEEVYSLSDDPKGVKLNGDPKWFVIDRLVVQDFEPNDNYHKRLLDSLDLAYKIGEDACAIYHLDKQSIERFSQSEACPLCGYLPPRLTLSSFSFNSHQGACSGCHGLGHMVSFLEENIVNKNLSVDEGALLPWGTQGYYFSLANAFCEKMKIPADVAYDDLSEKQKNLLLRGADKEVTVTYYSGGQKKKWTTKYPGLSNYLERIYKEGKGETTQERVNQYASWITCEECDGYRLNSQALLTKIAGIHIGNLAEMNVVDSLKFFENVKLSKSEEKIASKILKNCIDRLEFLQGVGLGYITISRRSNTLSGGESQRIRLATQIGSRLEGITYVLDEPSIGLHARDNSLLIKNLQSLTSIGNTLVVVEHDEEVMQQSDEIIDIGPGAGIHGGKVIFQGSYDKMLKDGKTETAAYLSGSKNIVLPSNDRKPGGFIEVLGAKQNNLKNVSVKIPLSLFTVITGVSGSGKSSLINRTLAPYLTNKLNRSRQPVGEVDKILGWEQVDKAIVIDQQPIGRTPRSNPATYTGLFTHVRDVFAQTNEAKKRGYAPGYFSFNTRDGRCEICEGDGVKKIEMHFLPDMYVTCEHCEGTRYNSQVREVKYKGKSISDVLDMTVEEASNFFEKFPKIKRILDTLIDVGLGYISLGQSATTLSGGESQRVKLATELSKRSTSKTFYILDEPTTGLHFSDIQKLLIILDKLVQKGNSVVVIEHNLDVIANADYIIDLGPEGGDGGGEIVFAGETKNLLTAKNSYTGKFLKSFLENKKK